MADWGPVVIATVLFVLLTPGLLFQIPGRNRVVEFGNMQTSGASILVHSVVFFGLITIFLIAITVHIYTGWLILPSFFSFMLFLSIYFLTFFFCPFSLYFNFVWWLWTDDVSALISSSTRTGFWQPIWVTLKWKMLDW